LSDEHGKHEDTEQPVERHEHVLDLDRRYGVVANRRGRLRRQIHAVKVAEQCTFTDHYTALQSQ